MMNSIDAVALAILFVNILLGFRRGVIKALSHAVQWALALLLAFYAYEWLVQGMELYFSWLLARVVAIVCAVALSMLLIQVLSRQVFRFVDMRSVGLLDRLIGGIVGLLKGVLICVLLAWLIDILPLFQSLKESSIVLSWFLLIRSWFI